MEKGEDKSLKSPIAIKEEEILAFWKENKIFEKSLEKKSPKGEFVFYDGPATANTKPVFHTMEPFAFKDLIPRYRTMRGYHVRRKGGWDTHGLPVELQIEKKLGFKSKKDIENFGIAEFNRLCKESVWEFIGLWKDFTSRMAYWADQDNAYVTYDNAYIESVWNVIKYVNDRNLLYKDYKVLPWCPRCGTALSSHELAQGYQDDKDLSVTAKFKVVGEENTYLLAWTTTPWTLPGNVALAVGADIDYVKIKKGEEFLILAKERLSIVEDEYKIVEEFKGVKLVGLKYEPLYHYLANKFDKKDPIAFEKSYQIYAAPFVNTEDGTGIVHTAVMYGQDDFVLGTSVGLPKHHLVKDDGHFGDDMDFLSGRFVKDEEVAVDIVKDLAKRGLLFDKKYYTHSYPHCWRCKTPLIYYARDSWYISMSKLRSELVRENEEIHWEPEHIKEGRFGEWLREIKDWALSRERYWGTPLPVWFDDEGNFTVLGSIEDLKKHIKTSGNKYFLMRHGWALCNEKNVESLNPGEENDSITEKGIAEAKKSLGKLKNIDLIVTSNFRRAKQTAELAAEYFGIPKNEIIVDEGLCEDEGTMEHFAGVRKRMVEAMSDLEKKNLNKNILVISHQYPLRVLISSHEAFNEREEKEKFEVTPFDTGEIREINFLPLPRNSNSEVDLHRPYIDEVELVDKNGKKLQRVKEVMDVWFDSGCMPFAQDHYPWNRDILYPADFISEAIDQTRGWFYTLHAIGVLMEKGRAFKNVICLGHILDKEGKKMSKSVGNVVDPWTVIDKFGVDALRLWMYSVNSPGDSKNFDEKSVDELIKKVFNPLNNIVAFYELYKDENTKTTNKSKNVLDKWILSRFAQLIKSGTENMDNFKVFESARPIRDFVNDFSTWYVRRSRDRFKSDNVDEKNEALGTTLFVLMELAKYMAPFTPFFAEEIYQKLKTSNDPESVHLENWPEAPKLDNGLLDQMEKARVVVSRALELRQKAGHKIRQPLQSLSIPEKFDREMLEIIADEVNVKVVKISGNEVVLDTNLTEELKTEGIMRDVIRFIQDSRKTKGLLATKVVSATIFLPNSIAEVVSTYKSEIIKITNLSELQVVIDKKEGEELNVDFVS